MGIKSKDFLELAKELYDIKNAPEANFRTSVSRSYYALFNYVKNCLQSMSFKIPKDAAGHQIAMRLFKYCGNEKLQEVAGYLEEMRIDRNKSDYDLDSTIDYQTAKFNYIKAMDSFKEITNETNGQNKKSQLQKDICKYIETTKQTNLL